MATKVYFYRYNVTGSFPFPFDILRYDRAWPTSGYDSSMMEELSQPGHGPATIALAGLSRPTVDRWKSFGWKVETATVFKQNLN